MADSEWTPRKPFDLRERLFDFGLLIIRITQFLHTRGPVAIALSEQVLSAGTSAGANYEEADDGSSPRDTLAKQKISLRELKECRFRLRLVRAAGFLTAEHDPVIEENRELVLILAAIVRKAEGKRRKRRDPS
jgi:four helix bundle protein